MEIAASPAAVFAWLADPERRLEWMGALAESEPLTEGPPAVGSRYRDVFEDHGQRVELEAELAELRPARRLRTSIVANGFESTSTQDLEETGRGTRLTTVVETVYTKRVGRIFAPLVTRHAQKQLEADHSRLKELVESEHRA